MENSPTYKELVAESQIVSKVASEEVLNALGDSDRATSAAHLSTWIKNVRRNMETLYPKHGSVGKNLLGLGADKATIGVGAGPSFHINKHVLKDVCNLNTMFSVEEQPFFILASNHQFKPMLKYGVTPHFVVLLDASAKINEQINFNKGKDTILIASLFSSPKVLNEWDKNGGNISFFLPDVEELKEVYLENTNDDMEFALLPVAGNVMNTMWLLAMRFLHSKWFLCTGNELSFDYSWDIEERKKSFYADNKIDADIDRFQIRDHIAWQGFENLQQSEIMGRPIIDFDTMMTSRQMFLYKMWTEIHITTWSESVDFHFFNCSEKGILGVLARSWDVKDMKDRNNWYMLDELTPKYHTMRLGDAVAMIMEAKCQKGIEKNANCVIRSPAKEPGIVQSIFPPQ